MPPSARRSLSLSLVVSLSRFSLSSATLILVSSSPWSAECFEPTQWTIGSELAMIGWTLLPIIRR